MGFFAATWASRRGKAASIDAVVSSVLVASAKVVWQPMNYRLSYLYYAVVSGEQAYLFDCIC